MQHLKLTRTLAIWVLTLFFSMAALAQSASPYYVQVNMIKVDRNKMTEYQDLLKNYGKKIWKERIAKGEIISVSAFTIGMHTGETDYNFATVTSANNVNALMNPASSPEEILKKLMPGASETMIREALAKYGTVRVVQSSMILRLVDGTAPSSSSVLKMYQLDYMRAIAGKESDYVKMEREVFKPMHEERVKAGQITDWGLWEVVMPYASESAFGYVTSTGYLDWDKLLSTDYGALYKKSFPKGDASKIGAMVNGSRTMVRSEYWREIMHEDKNTQ